MREYCDDTAHQQNLFQALSADIFLCPFQLLLHHHQPLSEGEIIPFSVQQHRAGAPAYQ